MYLRTSFSHDPRSGAPASLEGGGGHGVGVGRAPREVSRGPGSNHYQWVEGVDGVGNPVGFWSFPWSRFAQPRLPVPTPGTGRQCFPSGICVPIATGMPQGVGEEYWDPFDSGNPLLDTRGANRGLSLSPHFKVGELSSSGGQQFSVARIDPKLVACLEKIRMAVGRPVVVTSGYRSWGYNKRLYERRGQKPRKSQHCSGRAADIKIAGMTGFEVARVAIQACGCHLGIGVGMGGNKDGVHIDVRGKWAKWDYGGDKAKQYFKQIVEYHGKHC